MTTRDYEDSIDARMDAYYEEMERMTPARECHLCHESEADARGFECDVDHECANWICRACATELQRKMSCCSDECALRKVQAMEDELVWMAKEIREGRTA